MVWKAPAVMRACAQLRLVARAGPDDTQVAAWSWPGGDGRRGKWRSGAQVAREGREAQEGELTAD
jgi:hypothetical protein